MPVKRIPRSDGVATVNFSYGTLDRNSPAWSPVTGDAYRADKPRIESGIIPVYKRKPKIYYTFPEPTPFMGYDATHPAAWITGKYMTGVGGRMEEFEATYCQPVGPFEKILLGQSSGVTTFPKDVYAYRLTQTGAGDPLATKHCVISNLVHGNEAGGLDGAFKAMEFVGTDPDFADFRAEYTLLFVPCMNPDGFYSDLRNLEVVGPNGNTVNLNRNWDWFWAEYVESGSESKGAAPHDTVEAQNLLNYYALVVAAGGSFGALFDFHATASGVGARYQSRDRIWREIPYGPGEGGTVPESYLTFYLDHFIWRINRAVSTKRFLEAGGPDTLVRYQRSRFYPHLHSYFSSLGIFSMIAEEVKWYGAKGSSETIASSCNYRLDYITSFCHAVTTANWEFKDGVLLEQATENVLTNSNWEDWSVEDDGTQRPAYTSLTRASSVRTTKINGDKLFDDNGEAISVTSDVDVTLPDDSEYNVVAYATNPDTSKKGAVASIFPGNGVDSGLFFYPFEEPSAFTSLALATHTTLYAAGLFGAGSFTYYALGGGTGALTGASAQVTKLVVSTSYAVTETAIVGSGFTARMAAGSCFRRGVEGYLIGGQDAADAKLDTLGTFSMTTLTWALSTQTLPAPVIGCCCDYATSTGKVYIFGGESAGGIVDTICEWDPVTDILVDLTATLAIALPKALSFAGCAYEPSDSVIYIYGGQEASGDMSNTFYVFDPADNSIEEVTLYQNLSDDEDVEEAEESLIPWSIKQGRWGCAYSSGPKLITLVGGRIDSTVGSLTDGVYSHDPTDNTINLVRDSSFDYGYIRYGYAINVGTEPAGWLPGPQFVTSFANFEDRMSAWSIVGATCVSATGGPTYLLLSDFLSNDSDSTASSVTITARDQVIDASIYKSAALGSIVRFGLVVRAYYNNRAIDHPAAVTGVLIYETSSNNSSGSSAPYPQARLRYVAATTLLYYRAPGEASEGPSVNVGAGGLFTLYADTPTKYIKVFVDAASLPVGNVTESLDQKFDSTLTDGYRLLYTEADTTWTLQHVYGTEVRTLDTYVGSAISDSATRVKLSAIGQDPTTIRAWINGTERLTATDNTIEQITADDYDCAIEGCAGTADLVFDDFWSMQCPPTSQAIEEFGDSVFDQFSDPSTAWAVDATGYGYTAGGGGPLICTETLDYNNHKVECVVKKSGAGNIGSMSFAARATYAGAVLQRGYLCTIDALGTTASYYRVVAGVATLLATTSVSLTTAYKKFAFKVSGDNPVRLQLFVTGVTNWHLEYRTLSDDCYDYSEDRVTDTTGTCAITPVNGASTLYVRQVQVQSGAENQERFAHSIHVKSDLTNVSGYTRININPDDRYETADSITRYVRDYYTIAPSSRYWWYKLRTDFGDNAGRYVEDAIRVYQRVYKHAQVFQMDGMHLQRGSLIASSWQHNSAPRLAETMTFSDVINSNAFRVSFYWLPTCCFLDIREDDLEIFRMSIDANNYIKLYAKGYSGLDLKKRNYYISGWLSGPHDPEFILEKWRGGVMTAQISNINYWNHNYRTGASEREDCVVKFTVSHFATSEKNGVLEINIDNYGSEGVQRSYADLTEFSNYVGSIQLKGAGYYSEPEIEDVVQTTTGRKISTARRGVLGRIRNNDRPALLVGDRDPTGGELVFQPYSEMSGKIFGTGDNFTRANSTNLGSNWLTHLPYFSSRADKTSAKGFDLLGNLAVGYGNSVAYWAFRIGHADIRVTGVGQPGVNGDYIGVFSRYDDSLWNSDYGTWRGLTCYATHLVQVNPAQGRLDLVRWHMGTATTLATQVFNWYVAGTDYTIVLDLDGSTLTAIVSDGVNSETVSETDSNLQRSGHAGILVSAATTASFSAFNIEANFESEIE